MLLKRASTSSMARNISVGNNDFIYTYAIVDKKNNTSHLSKRKVTGLDRKLDKQGGGLLIFNVFPLLDSHLIETGTISQPITQSTLNI